MLPFPEDPQALHTNERVHVLYMRVSVYIPHVRGSVRVFTHVFLQFSQDKKQHEERF